MDFLIKCKTVYNITIKYMEVNYKGAYVKIGLNQEKPYKTRA